MVQSSSVTSVATPADSRLSCILTLPPDTVSAIWFHVAWSGMKREGGSASV
jgi:hypothetical protein